MKNLEIRSADLRNLEFKRYLGKKNISGSSRLIINFCSAKIQINSDK
jgi:hypothetical protein